MTTYKVERAVDKTHLAQKACQVIASHIDLVLGERDRAQVAFSGGSTPSETYRLLSQEHLPWDRVDLFLGDERWVDQEDKASNAGMTHRTLLASGPGAACKFHAIPTIQCPNPQESAEAFSQLLTKLCLGKPPIFDLILLGLGDDGHTASLFPESDSLKVNDCWATVGTAKGQERVTLTAPVLSAARKVVFLVSGSSKQIALQRLMDPYEPSSRTPARLVQPNSEILILADDEASSLI